MTAKQKEERIKKLIEEEKAAREDGEKNFFWKRTRIIFNKNILEGVFSSVTVENQDPVKLIKTDPDPTLIAEVNKNYLGTY